MFDDTAVPMKHDVEPIPRVGTCIVPSDATLSGDPPQRFRVIELTSS